MRIWLENDKIGNLMFFFCLEQKNILSIVSKWIEAPQKTMDDI